MDPNFNTEYSKQNKVFDSLQKVRNNFRKQIEDEWGNVDEQQENLEFQEEKENEIFKKIGKILSPHFYQIKVKEQGMKI